MSFEISNELIEQVKNLIQDKGDIQLQNMLGEIHFADIAEIIEELNLSQATYLIKLLDSEKTSEALMELEEILESAF